MTVTTSLIPGLEEILKQGDPGRLAEAARGIAERADLAERLSVLHNAPRALVGQLAREDEILIAGPLLRRSPLLDEAALVEIARLQGQGHLLAMSERATL